MLSLTLALGLCLGLLTAPALAAGSWNAPVRLAPQDAGTHEKYMEGSGGWFHPEASVTRAELAQMLSRITEDDPQRNPQFADVPRDAWYASAVTRVAGLMLMWGDDGYFRPSDPATRAECAAALSMFLPYGTGLEGWGFPDVPEDHWAHRAIAETAAFGLFQGDNEGLFHPDDGLKRCEVVAVFNRLLGRSADRAYIRSRDDLRTFPDVPAGHWAYWEIMEASVTHRCAPAPNGGELWSWAVAEPSVVIPPEPVLPDGPLRKDGRLYWVSGGEFVRDQSVGSLYFDGQGRYTTGDAELDEALNDIVESKTSDGMGRDEKLRALYNYCRDSFTYLKRPLITKDQTNWEPEYAAYFLKNGKGNCYNFSAAFCLLARELGLPAYTVVGGVLNGPHGWVEIQLDGKVYMFDPQLEWRYRHQYKKPEYDLFKMDPANTPFEYSR